MSARLERFRAQCIRYGESCTVTRRASTQGGTVTTQSVYFIVKPLTVGDDSPIAMEGALSGAQANALEFSCVGDADVREAVDYVTYGGSKFRLTNVNTHKWGGEAISLHATGVRTQ